MLARMVEEETDMGPRSIAAARAPLSRLCLASREVTPVADMLRFVVGPDGRIVPDIASKLPGRGAWVRATRSALEMALKRKAFARAFKGKGNAGPELPALVDQLFEQDARAALSLANKAGQVVTGAMKVESALASGKVRVLVHAADARPDGVRKLDATARQAHAMGAVAPAIVNSLPGMDLDLALGRSNVVHAALLAHPTTAGFLARCRRLERWRTGTDTGVEDGASPASDGRTTDGRPPDDPEDRERGQGGPVRDNQGEFDPGQRDRDLNGPNSGDRGPDGGDLGSGQDRSPDDGSDLGGRKSSGQECSRAPGRMQGTETE